MNLGAGEERLGPFGVLRTFWGVAAVLVLCAYSLYQVFDHDPAVADAFAPLALGTPVPTPVLPPVFVGPPRPEAPLTLYLVCDPDDARALRAYDLQAPGRGNVLRLDLEPENVRAVYLGTSFVFQRTRELLYRPASSSS